MTQEALDILAARVDRALADAVEAAEVGTFCSCLPTPTDAPRAIPTYKAYERPHWADLYPWPGDALK